MAKWEDYVITKVSFNQGGNRIEAAYVYDDYDERIGNGELRNRDWLVAEAQKGKTFCTAAKVEGGWSRKTAVLYQNGGFQNAWYIPKALPERKTFLSYYHHDDQSYKKYFETITADLFTNKSVQHNDIDAENSDGYIKQLIQKEFINDVTILIVLVGSKTRCRKHVDWEIAAALNYKVGDRHAGLIGLLLPEHPDYGRNGYSSANLPQRLAANVASGYAKLYDWTTDRVRIQKLVEDAFSRRTEEDKIINHSIVQMQRNTCD